MHRRPVKLSSVRRRCLRKGLLRCNQQVCRRRLSLQGLPLSIRGRRRQLFVGDRERQRLLWEPRSMWSGWHGGRLVLVVRRRAANLFAADV